MTGTINQIRQLLQIGTSRAGGAALDDSGMPAPLRAPLQAMPAQSQEERLWLTLGALDLWQRSGYVPAHVPEAAEAAQAPCGGESLRPCPAGAAQMLGQLLRDVQPGLPLRAEWLRLAARHNCHPPAAQLPGLLALATRHRELRAATLPVLGERGRWLARQSPAWSWAARGPQDAGGQELWHTGDAAQRVAQLTAWREADPVAALAALQADWAAEPPESRAALLPCLAVRLGADDVPFLETVLDDKRKEVRLQAQALLAALPASPLAQRMRERAAPLLRLEPHVFSADRLRIVLPETCDKAMQRDGVGAVSHPGLGEKAGWLADIVAATPLAYWQSTLGDPATCLKLAAATEFEHALLRGWTLAVRRQGGAAWFAVLAQRWTQGGHALRQQYPRDFFGLFALLPAPSAHAVLALLADGADAKAIVAALADGTGGPPPSVHGGAHWTAASMPLLELLQQAAVAMAPDTWPYPLSEAIVVGLKGGLPALTPHAWTVKGALPSLALVLDPAVADSAAHGWPDSDPAWSDWADGIARFLDTLRFRRQLTLSFEEQTS